MPQADRLRILIADDHTLFRRGVREVLEETDDLVVIAEAADGEQAVRLTAQLRPDKLDLVLMDVDMPVLDGIKATQRITAIDPGLPVVMLTVSADDADLFAAVRAGAVGFLRKGLSATALVRALHDFHTEGALPMSRVMAARLISHLRAITADEAIESKSIKGPDEVRSAPQSLTEREQEVLDLIAIGARDRDIAERLYLTQNTVKKHVKNILHKLGARNRAQAATYHRERSRLPAGHLHDQG